MGKKKLIIKGIILICVLLLLACQVGKKEYEAGLQYADAGRYKEAIAALEEAIAKEPNNQEYIKALSDIKNAQITKFTGEAKKALGKTPVSISAINKATDNLTKAQEINNQHPSVISLKSQVDKAKSTLESDVKSLYTTTNNFIRSGDYTKAYFNLQQIQSRYPNYEDSFMLLRRVKDEGSQVLYKKAQDRFKQEDFKGALEYLRDCLALMPDNGAARKLRGVCRKNDNKEYFLGAAKKAALSQQWDRAVKCYERALKYDAKDAELRQIILHVKSKAGGFYVGKARAYMQDGWILKAFDCYDLAVTYVKNPSDFRINSLRTDLTARASFLAEKFKEESKYGGAWFWYTKIKDVDPAFPRVFFLIQEMEDSIKLRVQKSIAVFDFSSPASSSDAGVIVANNLITYLFKNASGDIKILARENLKSILEEMKLGQIGVINENNAKEMGRVYGIDVAIMGSVLQYIVDTTSSEGTKTVRYKTGTKIEDNIDYLNWLAKHPSPTKEQIATAPPAKKMVPEYTTKDYRVSNHKKVGLVQISFRIVDVSTGENIQVKTIESKQTVEDATSAGVPEADIKFDPLSILTDTELLQKMANDVVARLGRETLVPLRNLEKKYYTKGETMLKRRNGILAVESFVDAIFDENLKRIPSSPMSKKAHKYIYEIFLSYKAML